MKENKNLPQSYFIANYELNDYDYDQFWNGREYEHKAETMLLSGLMKKYIPESKKYSIMDIGGAYGRLAPLYSDFSQFFIADYSTRELRRAQKMLSGFDKKMTLVAMNVYHMPFKDNSINNALSVRLIHHIATPQLMMDEIYRILSPGGTFILETAHKHHILGYFKALFRRKLGEFLSPEPHRVIHKPEDSQGINESEGQISIMYAFSKSQIESVVRQAGFEILAVRSGSFFRSNFLKRLIPLSLLLIGEKIMQSLFGWWHVTPSLFFVLRKPGDLPASNENLDATKKLACPICHGELKYSGNAVTCVSCQKEFSAVNQIFDLREPSPDLIDF